MNRLTVDLLQLSPCPALRISNKVAQKYPSVGRELFNVAFLSCWSLSPSPLRTLSFFLFVMTSRMCL